MVVSERKSVVKSVFNRRLALVLALLITFSVSGVTRHTAAQASAGGRLRFLHAVPGAPAIDVWIDKVVAVRSLEYTQATRFIMVTPGDHTVAILPAGSNTPVFQGKVSVSAGQAETVIAQGTASAVEAGIYEDDLGPTSAGNTRFTASQAIKDAPATDVIKTDGSPLIQGLKYGTVYGAFDIPATAANLAVVPAGGAASSALVEANNLSLVAGTNNRLVVVGMTSGTDKPSYVLLTAAVDPDDPTQSTLVRFVHANSAAPAIDVYVGGKLIAPGLTFGKYTPHISLAVGTADVTIRAAGSTADSAALAMTSLTLAAGKAMTVVIAGNGDSSAFQTSEDNISALAATSARVHVINATGSGTATVKFNDVTATATGTKVDAKGTELTANTYKVAVSVDSPNIQLTGSQPISGGVLYDVIVAGTADKNTLIVAATGLNEQPNSAPGSAQQVVESTGAATQEVASASTQQGQPTTQSGQPTGVVTVPAVQPTANGAAQPTATAAVVVTQPPEQTATPVPPAGVIATVATNAGSNLNIRQFPRVDAFVLARVPSGTELTVTGMKGQAATPTGTVPAATATSPASAPNSSFTDIWFFITWSAPDGGTVTGWVNGQYVNLTKGGRPIVNLATMTATLKLVDPATAGEANTTSVTPLGPS